MRSFHRLRPLRGVPTHRSDSSTAVWTASRAEVDICVDYRRGGSDSPENDPRLRIWAFRESLPRSLLAGMQRGPDGSNAGSP